MTTEQKRVLIFIATLVVLIVVIGLYRGAFAPRGEQIEVPPEVLEPLCSSGQTESTVLSERKLRKLTDRLRSLSADADSDIIELPRDVLRLLCTALERDEPITLHRSELTILLDDLETLARGGEVTKRYRIPREVLESIIITPDLPPIETPPEMLE